MDRILFIRFSSLGDAILTTGIIRHFEGAHILTYAEFAPVWQGIVPTDNIHTIPRGMKLADYIKFLRTMPEFDYIFDLHANTRSAIARKLISGKAYKYKKQSACRRLYVKFHACSSALKRHTVQKYAEAVFPALNLPIPPMEELRPYLGINAATDPLKIVIHPYASKFTKEWKHFPILAERLSKLGYNVVVVGNGALSKKTTLTELFDIMSDASLVISTDSGPMHIAVALNRKVVAIFGSTTKEFGFYPEFSGCTVIERDDVKCRPCHVHGQKACPKGHFDCMNISVESVLEAACRMIKD
ncbi:MAG: glycosyltransferase family 9 protein [Deferribacteraceae bacterium]|jgi:ADP-heptose:LPS heptosyltransferase|nr:glycosyltransferase family 9 protein [Deferribacteraceae bacterium]